MAHLWTGEPPPLAYIELILCRDIYHCTRSQLYKENLTDIFQDLICLDAESKIKKLKG